MNRSEHCAPLFVESAGCLGQISDYELVASTIAQAVAVKGVAGEAPLDTLKSLLAEERLLLS